DNPLVNIKISDQKENGEAWLKKRNAKAFYQTIVAPTVRHGTIALLQVSNDECSRRSVLAYRPEI
ncbi:unnamed protein product, partial [Rotaria magnacalcarata]